MSELISHNHWICFHRGLSRQQSTDILIYLGLCASFADVVSITCFSHQSRCIFNSSLGQLRPKHNLSHLMISKTVKLKG
jgi:hypothetical protein